MARFVYDFEKPLHELEQKIREMELTSSRAGIMDDMSEEIVRLKQKLKELAEKINGNLTRWQRVELARHPDRPHTLDFIQRITSDWIELHGDRAFGDDHAVVAGLGRIDNYRFAIVGQQKGRTTKENLYHNFGMSRPEGYRKARRIFKMAEKFGLPVLTLIDTPGAYPGIGAEERGQAEAIARNLQVMSHLKVPIIVVVIGEGASGGALGIGVGDRLLMLENTWYSVISPEGCASILYRDAGEREKAAEAMRVTAQDLLEMGIADRLIPEPPGGAHRDWDQAAALLKQAVLEELPPLMVLPPEQLVARRIEKLSKMGKWEEKE